MPWIRQSNVFKKYESSIKNYTNLDNKHKALVFHISPADTDHRIYRLKP